MEKCSDYELAKAFGLTNPDRWDDDVEHHPMSVRLFRFIEEHDYKDYDDATGYKSGGDGDNGELLMYEMDAFFELLDLEKKNESQTKGR